MGDPEKHDARNNLWQYAPPFHIFVSHGYEVEFASPTGGPVPFMMDSLGISSYTIKHEGFLVQGKRVVSTMFLPSAALVAKKMITLPGYDAKLRKSMQATANALAD